MAAVDELVAASAHAGSVEILVALRLSADRARTVNNRRPPAGKGRLPDAFVTVSIEVRFSGASFGPAPLGGAT
jgi:predicted alpha/beta-hydrolase family hydrolase